MKIFRMIFLAVLLISLCSFYGCSGCEKEAKTSKPTVSKFSKTPAKVKSTPNAAKSSTPTAPAKTTSASKEDREKILRIMPEVANIFQSPEFKTRLEEASKNKDIRGFLTSMQEALTTACQKEGLDFESCMKLLNENKDDKEVQDAIAKWRDNIDFAKPQ